MGASDTTEKPSRDKSGRFSPGNRVNPTGRPQGSRHHALIALDKIGEDHAADVLRRVVADAIAGDVRSAEIILNRVWPARKGRPVFLPFAEVKTAADVVGAMANILAGLSNGTISPEEAQAVAGVIEGQRRAIETADLEARIAKLEAEPVPGDEQIDSLSEPRPSLPVPG